MPHCNKAVAPLKYPRQASRNSEYKWFLTGVRCIQFAKWNWIITTTEKMQESSSYFFFKIKSKTTFYRQTQKILGNWATFLKRERQNGIHTCNEFCIIVRKKIAQHLKTKHGYSADLRNKGARKALRHSRQILFPRLHGLEMEERRLAQVYRHTNS